MAGSDSVRAAGRRAWPFVVVMAGLAPVGAGCHAGAAGGVLIDAGGDAPDAAPPDAAPPDVYCAPDAAGGGQCPLNFCGQPKSVAALPTGQISELGADSICTPGYLCVPDAPTADGAALQLRCVAPRMGAVAFGADCTTGSNVTSPCGNDALCVATADAPSAPFCSRLCRADADCPSGASCVEHKSANLPNGSYVDLGFCTPKAKIPATACLREADCAADEGCVSYGARTSLLVCQKAGGTKSLGDACVSGADCRSGECYDRAFRLHASGSRSYCSGHCQKSSDCSADQRCTRVVLSNNGTPADPRDDVVAGYCETLYVPSAGAGCQSDADCTTGGADTCQTTYGLCYKKGAATGTACTADVGCDLGAQCSTGQVFPHGYCQTFGCAPGATTGPDSCPGATATCAQRASDAPVHSCYEGCKTTSDCSREPEQFICSPVDDAPTTPNSICLYNQGV